MAESNSQTDPFSNIPTAPTIEVRTLHGDVQSMSSSGGAAMQVEDVTEMIGRKTVPISTPRSGGNLLFKIIVLVLVILIAAVAVGFIINSGIAPNLFSVKNIISPASSTATSSPLPAYVPTSSTVNFDPYADIESERFLRIPADTSFSLALSRESAETAQDLLTFSQKISENLKTVPSQNHFIEVQLEKDGGKPADGITFMTLSGIHLFTNQFFTDNFSPNMMAFVYRDSKGSWPGYIFKLLPNKTPRLVASEVQFLERSSSITNTLFLSDPGAPTGVFVDGQRAGLPTREQSYSTPGAAIGYGWQDKYLIISTSLDGLQEAFHRIAG